MLAVFYFLILFIYLVLAVLGLLFCVTAFLSLQRVGTPLIVALGLLVTAASLVTGRSL